MKAIYNATAATHMHTRWIVGSLRSVYDTGSSAPCTITVNTVPTSA